MSRPDVTMFAAAGAPGRRLARARAVDPGCPFEMRAGLAGGILLLALWALGVPLPARAGDARGLPARLSDTGLQAGSPDGRLIEFSPQYPLWSDGATKRRWIYLPPGTFIDAADPDAWVFPRGTKLWKEFSHGAAVETRYLERGADGVWRFGSYVWDAQGREAWLAPAAGIRGMAVPRAPDGRYDIPAEDDCRACHEGAPVPVLGFSALQLSPDRDPAAPHADAFAAVDLRTLAARGLLRNLPAAVLARPPRIIAADARERAALGYLHGNCGHCHNDDGPLAMLELNLSQRLNAAPAAARRSILGVPSQVRATDAPVGTPRLAPGHFSSSAIAIRMRSRDPLQQMPPLGTTQVDADALALLAAWVDGLSSN